MTLDVVLAWGIENERLAERPHRLPLILVPVSIIPPEFYDGNFFGILLRRKSLRLRTRKQKM